MEKCSLILMLLSMTILIDALALDYFHCKAATCQQFHYGLRKFPRRDDYVKVCHNTVSSLQNITQVYGKCFDETTNKINSACIYALATTMRNCVHQLRDVPENYARYYCGYQLMQNCAKNIGLERFPLKIDYQRPDEDENN